MGVYTPILKLVNPGWGKQGGGWGWVGSGGMCVCFLERFIELNETVRFTGIYEWFISATIWTQGEFTLNDKTS